MIEVFTGSHQHPCGKRQSHGSAPNRHSNPRNRGEAGDCGDSGIVEGLVVNVCDDGESSGEGLLAGRLDLLLWQQVAELTWRKILPSKSQYAMLG